MTDRILTASLRCLLGILLLLSLGDGLRAQCSGPFDLSCWGNINLTLEEDCRASVSPSMVLTNLPACLVDSNFTILIEDDAQEDGPVANGPGRYRYVVTGQNHPDLTGFTCSGFVTLEDATPPVIDLLPGPIDRGCNLRTLADINLLPAEVARCYVIDGDTGQPRSGSLDNRLAQALLAGGGVPTVYDACGGDVEVCVNDAFSNPNPGACIDTVLLQRSFRARDLDGNPNFAPAFRAQNIRFLRPQLSQIQGVDNTVSVTCQVGPAGVNPLPATTDFPFFSTNSGPVYLDEGFCDFEVDFVDDDRIEGCGNNYFFVRTFRIADWCNGAQDTLFTQVVRVGDSEGPVISLPTQDLDFNGEPDDGPLTYSTNTGQCSAVLDLSVGVSLTDACSSATRLDAYLFVDGDLSSPPLGPYGIVGGMTNSITTPIPSGQHLLRFEGSDLCNNTSTEDIALRIVDGNPPMMVCEEQVNISLDGNGRALITATSFDAGSNDGCSTIDFLIAKVNQDDLPITVLNEHVFFSCSDLGEQRLVLIGRDQNGNENRCLGAIIIEDDTAPSCFTPNPVSLHCQLYASQFPEDLPAAFAADPTGVGNQLNIAFGNATGADNCSIDTLTQTVFGEINDCGTGQFFRQFTVTDAAGFTQSTNCIQTIHVLPFTEYSLRFPGDQNYTCDDFPDPEDFTGESGGCELLVVNTFRDTLTSSVPGSCYALQLTHEVINWCEYDGQSLPYTLPRDADGNGDFREPLFLNISANAPNDYLDDQAILDQDTIVGNGNDLGQLGGNYGTSSRRGYFRYFQFVGVFDDEPPSLVVEDPEDGLAFTADCLGGVAINLVATDECSDVQITATIDETLVDRNGDGEFTSVDFLGEYDIPEVRFTGEAATGLTVPVRNLPIGLHFARIQVTDGCGNQTQQFVVMQVNDGRPPAPICISTVTVDLVPDIVTGGINTVWATDFVGSPTVTCTQTSVSYSLYREEEAAVQGFIPQQEVFNVEVDCSDLGPNILRLYAFAENTGLAAFCNVVLTVTDSNDLCSERMGQISGLILDRNGDPMRNVEVFNDGPSSLVTFSEADGTFLFDGLEEQADYTIRPYLDANPINGLSTADLNIIGRRLLGLGEDFTPYQLIAADANNNGSITVRDLIAIREVILGFEDDFENNNSWRFVPADYIFPNPENPWIEEFPEVANFNGLVGAEFVEFVAIKIGDVTGNAEPHFAFLPENDPEINNRSEGIALTLRQESQQGIWGLYAPGANVAANAGAKDRVTAVQGAIQLPAGTRLLPGLLSTAEYRVDKDNVLRFSRVAAGHQLNHQTPLLQFSIGQGAMPTLLSTSNGFYSEAYTADYRALPLRLKVTGEESFANPLLRATPSPFHESTQLTVNWLEEEQLALTIMDATGRVALQRMVEAHPGGNQWTLHRQDIGGKAGVYVVRLSGNKNEQILRVVLR